MTPQTVSELGEAGLLRRIAQRLGSPVPDEVWGGDDAAVVRGPSGDMVFTTDALVEGVDFELSYASPEDVGWKVIAVNASDAAAMGATPTHALVTLLLPPDTSVAFVDGALEGMIAAAERWGIHLVGGDISRARLVALSVAVIGVPFKGGVVLRSGARTGDAICVTGSLGGAAGGLIALQRGLATPEAIARERAVPSGAEAAAILAERQLRPRARVQEAELIGLLGPTSMIDISDGLAVDLDHLVTASGTGCRVEREAIPVDPELRYLADRVPEIDPTELAILGGEDFELLFTIDAGRVEDAQVALDDTGVALSRIGTIVEEERTLAGRALAEWTEMGWDHLQNR